MDLRPIEQQRSELTLEELVKGWEVAETGRRGEKGKPIVARLDGRSFSNFTRGLQKPFDLRLTYLMRDTAKFLVEQTSAVIGYTQSDEISLVWYMKEGQSGQYFFDGRYQKLASILSSMATGYFIRELDARLPEKAGLLPMIDARVFQVPSLRDAGKVLLQRERDAMKNSVTMAASAHFSHKQLQGVNSSTKKQWLVEKGQPWEELPAMCRKGSYFRREKVMRELTLDELSLIPEGRRPDGPIERTEVLEVAFPDLNTLDDLTVIFDRAESS